MLLPDSDWLLTAGSQNISPARKKPPPLETSDLCNTKYSSNWISLIEAVKQKYKATLQSIKKWKRLINLQPQNRRCRSKHIQLTWPRISWFNQKQMLGGNVEPRGRPNKNRFQVFQWQGCVLTATKSTHLAPACHADVIWVVWITSGSINDLAGKLQVEPGSFWATQQRTFVQSCNKQDIN